MKRPEKTEYHPYYETYIQKVPEGDFMETFRTESTTTITLLESLSEAQWNHAYAPGKWTIKEAVMHMMDTERIFAYRALRIARGDKTPLAGFEQDDYVPNSKANSRSGKNILEEFKALRRSTEFFIQSLTEEMQIRQGTASGANVSVRGICYKIIGHELHHREIIEERYLKS